MVNNTGESGPTRRRQGGSSSEPPLESPLPTSPRSLNRQAKLHRLLKQLHSQAEAGSEEEAAALAAAASAGHLGPLGEPGPTVAGVPLNGAGGGNASGGKRKRGRDEASGDGESGGGAASSTNGAAGSSSSSGAGAAGRPPSLKVEVDDGGVIGGGGRSGQGGGRGGRGGGRGRGGGGGGSSSQPAQPNFRGGRGGKAKGSSSSSAGGAAPGPQLEAPRCIFKSHNFTPDPPPETRYDFGAVPGVERDLSGSVLLRPVSRRQWFVCIQELESLAQESLDRRASRLSMNTPSGLPLVYIADRMDIDDPLWGYQLRCEATGWLQGFITCTVFTTWTHFFEWNSNHLASGMAAARIANSWVGKEDPALTTSDGGETVQQVAHRVGVKPADLVKWNLGRFSSMSINSRVQPGTVFLIADPCAPIPADLAGSHRPAALPLPPSLDLAAPARRLHGAGRP